MKKIKLDTKVKEIFADCITPVTLYLKLRDKYPNSLLLESSDYHGNKHSYSYICCYPICKQNAVQRQCLDLLATTESSILKI